MSINKHFIIYQDKSGIEIVQDQEYYDECMSMSWQHAKELYTELGQALKDRDR